MRSYQIVVAMNPKQYRRLDSPLGVRHRLPLCANPDENLVVLRHANNRRKSTRALAVVDHGGCATFEDCDTRVCSSEVYANDMAHDPSRVYQVLQSNQRLNRVLHWEAIKQF